VSEKSEKPEKPEKPEPPKDVVLVHARTDDGQGVHVIRSREERLEVGVMRPLEEGRPIQGEVVKLTQRPEFPMLFDAETQVVATGELPAVTSSKRASSSGPAQVASDKYRQNWDAIWKRGKRPKELPN
jgi:hypothetical protein